MAIGKTRRKRFKPVKKASVTARLERAKRVKAQQKQSGKSTQRKGKGGGRRSTFTINGKTITDSRDVEIDGLTVRSDAEVEAMLNGGGSGKGGVPMGEAARRSPANPTGNEPPSAYAERTLAELVAGAQDQGVTHIPVGQFFKRYDGDWYKGDEPLEPRELELFADAMCRALPMTHSLVRIFSLKPRVGETMPQFRNRAAQLHYRIRHGEWFKRRQYFLWREMDKEEARKTSRVEAREFLREVFKNEDVPMHVRVTAAKSVKDDGERTRAAEAAIEKHDALMRIRPVIEMPVVVVKQTGNGGKGESGEKDVDAVDAEWREIDVEAEGDEGRKALERRERLTRVLGNGIAAGVGQVAAKMEREVEKEVSSLGAPAPRKRPKLKARPR